MLLAAYIDWILLLHKIVGGELFKMASETILKQKEAEVSALADKFKEAKVILLTEYRGINVADDTKLRNEIRNANAQYRIIKNNIVRRALNANGENGLDELLEGPTAVVIGNEDYLEPAKVIYNLNCKIQINILLFIYQIKLELLFVNELDQVQQRILK